MVLISSYQPSKSKFKWQITCNLMCSYIGASRISRYTVSTSTSDSLDIIPYSLKSLRVKIFTVEPDFPILE